MEENKSDLLLRFTEILIGSRKEESLEVDEAQKIIIDSITNSPAVPKEARKMFITTGIGKSVFWTDTLRKELEEHSYLAMDEVSLLDKTDMLSEQSLYDEFPMEELAELEEKAKEPNMRVTTRNFLNKGRRW